MVSGKIRDNLQYFLSSQSSAPLFKQGPAAAVYPAWCGMYSMYIMQRSKLSKPLTNHAGATTLTDKPLIIEAHFNTASMHKSPLK
jgi:hypothetical protein